MMRFSIFALIIMVFDLPLIAGDLLRAHGHRTLYDTTDVRHKEAEKRNLDSLFLEDDTQWRRMLDSHISMDTAVSMSMPP
mmetsp:Transcript_16140/g.23743  ORF Transcript_16140/g.23743 Transcript_16140/m.23743 type:complete len:80 (+) Transcript_16140:102-341(+)